MKQFPLYKNMKTDLLAAEIVAKIHHSPDSATNCADSVKGMLDEHQRDLIERIANAVSNHRGNWLEAVAMIKNFP